MASSSLPLFDHRVTYPDHPGFKVPGTSEEAARRVRGSAKVLRERVLVRLRERAAGMTADEIAEDLNLSVLSVRPRVSELNRLGEIRKNGLRRRNASGLSASVWVVSPPSPAVWDSRRATETAPGAFSTPSPLPDSPDAANNSPAATAPRKDGIA